MNTRSARINLLVTPEEKAKAQRDAAAQKLSLSDYIRRSLRKFDPILGDDELTEEQIAELKIMAKEMPATIERINNELDEMHAKHLEWLDKMNALRRENGYPEL